MAKQIAVTFLLIFICAVGVCARQGLDNNSVMKMRYGLD